MRHLHIYQGCLVLQGWTAQLPLGGNNVCLYVLGRTQHCRVGKLVKTQISTK